MIIGLHGKKQSGKDYGGEYLARTYGVKVMKFAAPLYEVCTLVELGREYLLANLLRDHKLLIGGFHDTYDLAFYLINTYQNTPSLREREHGKRRKLLQWVGTDVFREKIDREYWLKLFKESVPYEGDVVVTDVRFQNEASCCDKVIHIVGGIDGDSHVSENDPVDWHYSVDNTERRSDYLTVLGELYERITGR